jgi:hypothetical protein
VARPYSKETSAQSPKSLSHGFAAPLCFSGKLTLVPVSLGERFGTFSHSPAHCLDRLPRAGKAAYTASARRPPKPFQSRKVYLGLTIGTETTSGARSRKLESKA